MRYLATPILLILLLGVNIQAQSQSILPADPAAQGGGNPLQGLGRPDDPSPPRYNQVGGSGSAGSATSGANNAGLGSTIDAGGLGSTIGGQGLGSSIDAQGLGTTIDTQGLGTTDESAGATPETDSIPAGVVPAAGPGEGTLDGGSDGADGTPATDSLNSGLPPETSIEGPNDGSTTVSESESTSSPRRSGTTGGGSPFPSRSKTPNASERLNILENGGKPGQIGFMPNLKQAAPKDMQELTSRLRQAMEKAGAHKKPAEKPVQKKKSGLLPPPPPTVPGNTVADTPARRAMLLIHHRQYGEAETKLREIVSATPDDLHSQYLLAITLVLRKKYDEARATYKLILNRSNDPKLIELAETGLKKLD